MKRDMDLVREILLVMEKDEKLQFKDYAPEQIGYHVHIMAEAGLVRAVDVTTRSSNFPQSMPLWLTWEGHEFLDAARQLTLWERAKQRIASVGGAVTTELLIKVLQKLASDQLGI